MDGKIFISYKREDSSWSTGRIYDRLSKYFSEKQIFIDVDSIAPGDDFITHIEEAVRNCDVLLAIIGQKWLESIQKKRETIDFVTLEITTAFKYNVKVIPVLVEQTKMPLEKDLPDELKPLARRNAFLVNHVSFNSEMTVLVQTLKNLFLQNAKEIERERQKTLEEEQRINSPVPQEIEGGKNNLFKLSKTKYLLFIGFVIILAALIWLTKMKTSNEKPLLTNIKNGFEKSATVKPEHVLTVLSSKKNFFYYEGELEPDASNFKLSSIEELHDLFTRKKQSLDTNVTVVIKQTKESPYENFRKIISELQILSIENYVVVDISTSEDELVKVSENQ